MHVCHWNLSKELLNLSKIAYELSINLIHYRLA